MGGLQNGYYDFFAQKLRRLNNTYFNANSKIKAVGVLPKYIVELIIYVGIIVFFLYQVAIPGQSNENIANSLAIIGIFGTKLIPAFQSIYAATSSLKSNYNVLQKYVLLFREIVYESHKKIFKFNEIKLKDIEYIQDKKKILSNLNFDIRLGDKVLIMGPSGSGKTTLIKILAGLYQPQKGSIYINGKITKDYIFSNCFYISQDEYLMPDTVSANVALGVKSMDVNQEKLCSALSLVNLSEFTSTNNTINLTTQVGVGGVQLSGGQKQRVLLSRIFYNEYELVILDEPTSALDSQTADIVLRNILKVYKHKTVIIVTHDKRFVSYFNKVLEL